MFYYFNMEFKNLAIERILGLLKEKEELLLQLQKITDNIEVKEPGDCSDSVEVPENVILTESPTNKENDNEKK